MSRSFPALLSPFVYFGKWLLMTAAVAALSGSASAWFLIALRRVTALREAHPGLIWLLPVAGALIGVVYYRLGKEVEEGNRVLVDGLRKEGATVPLRMVPLVMGSSVVSHLFGASVGREGAAVQMGGALADGVGSCLRLTGRDRRLLLMSGMSAGFASIFGTPLAGALFGLEAGADGRLRWEGALPCLLAAVMGDWVCLAWGVKHVAYPWGGMMLPGPAALGAAFGAVIVAGVVFGLFAMLFVKGLHAARGWVKRAIGFSPLRPVVGGVLIALAVWAFGGSQFLGLGDDVVVRSFQEPIPPGYAFGKLAFTVASLGTGFRGGEVTPLFFMGATLGNGMAPVLGLPYMMLAALGFVAIFAAASNAPLASTVMAMELFGFEIGALAAVACFTAYFCSGRRGLYHLQEPGRCKYRGLMAVAAWAKKRRAAPIKVNPGTALED